MKKSGQPTKLLKPGVRETILKYIANGNYIKTACLAANIRPETYCNWQQWASDCENNPSNGNENKEIYFQFFQELKNAEAMAEAERTKSIDAAGEKPQYWMAKAWINERKDPERWARREVIDIRESAVLVALRANFHSLRNDVAKETLCDTPKLETERKQLTTGGDRE